MRELEDIYSLATALVETCADSGVSVQGAMRALDQAKEDLMRAKLSVDSGISNLHAVVSR